MSLSFEECEIGNGLALVRPCKRPTRAMPSVIVCHPKDQWEVFQLWQGSPIEFFVSPGINQGYYLCLDGDVAKAFIEGRSVNPVCQEGLEEPV